MATAKSNTKEKTALIKLNLGEALTLHQILSTYEIKGPVDQLVEIIPRFMALKSKVTIAVNELQDAFDEKKPKS